jgi:D-inositol-3-phosphate glycosyltransferase
VQANVTGTLVRPADPAGMAQAIRAYVEDPGLRARHGLEARRAAERRFSMEEMVKAYMAVYDNQLARHARHA